MNVDIGKALQDNFLREKDKQVDEDVIQKSYDELDVASNRYLLDLKDIVTNEDFWLENIGSYVKVPPIELAVGD